MLLSVMHIHHGGIWIRLENSSSRWLHAEFWQPAKSSARRAARESGQSATIIDLPRLFHLLVLNLFKVATSMMPRRGYDD